MHFDRKIFHANEFLKLTQLVLRGMQASENFQSLILRRWQQCMLLKVSINPINRVSLFALSVGSRVVGRIIGMEPEAETAVENFVSQAETTFVTLCDKILHV